MLEKAAGTLLFVTFMLHVFVLNMHMSPSLLSYTFRYVSLPELGTLCRVGFRDPMHLCTSVSEEGGD